VWSESLFGVCRGRRADLVVMAGFLQLVADTLMISPAA